MKSLLYVLFILLVSNAVMAQDLELKPQTISTAQHDSVLARMASGMANAIAGLKDTDKVKICICCGGAKHAKRPSPMMVLQLSGKRYLLDSLGMNNLNPDNIQNIEVIGDKSSVAYLKYGGSAKYGVILIGLKDEKYPNGLTEFKGHVIKQIDF